MRFLLPILILLSPALHGAPLTFKGEGSAFFPQRARHYPCSEVSVRFELLPNKLRFLEGGYSCGPLEAEYDPFVLDIKDGKLFSKGEEVGDISDNEMNLYHYDESDDSTFHLCWKFQKDQIEYVETWDQAGLRALEVKSIMKALQ